MLISDWSSDVCSSDLGGCRVGRSHPSQLLRVLSGMDRRQTALPSPTSHRVSAPPLGAPPFRSALLPHLRANLPRRPPHRQPPISLPGAFRGRTSALGKVPATDRKSTRLNSSHEFASR